MPVSTAMGGRAARRRCLTKTSCSARSSGLVPARNVRGNPGSLRRAAGVNAVRRLDLTADASSCRPDGNAIPADRDLDADVTFLGHNGDFTTADEMKFLKRKRADRSFRCLAHV